VDRINKGAIYAFAGGGRSGEPRWAFRLPKDDLSAPAIAKDGTLYFVSGGRLYALDAENGRLKWELPLLNLSSPPAVDEARGLVFALGSDGRLFAVSREGRMVWETMLDGGASQPPLAGPDALYVATDRGTLYRLAAGP
ncbi:MAG: outer membrane protein assembly factor BamB family protein, partial [Desulfotomaculales bacterium]